MSGYELMKQSPFGTSSHVVSTVCPLDCPDCCSLDVTVQDGKVTMIDGSHANPVTGGYICAKVRRFPERVYGDDRLLYPAVRQGTEGPRALRARLVGPGARPHRDAHSRDTRADGAVKPSCPTRTAAPTAC